NGSISNDGCDRRYFSCETNLSDQAARPAAADVLAIDEHGDAARVQNDQVLGKLTLAHQFAAGLAVLPEADTANRAHVTRFKIKHQCNLQRLLVSAEDSGPIAIKTERNLKNSGHGEGAFPNRSDRVAEPQPHIGAADNA